MDDATARARMVADQLVARGITDDRVLDAFRTVPRERFVPDDLRRLAHEDRPLAIGHGQTISQPYVVALTVQAMEVGPDDRVLDVGTGSGYAAAVLGHLAAEVWTVERLPALADRAADVLAELGIVNVHVVTGDGSLGLAGHAPYGAVGVAAAAPHVPQALVDQLGDGGRLVLPVEDGRHQSLVRLRRDGADVVREHLLDVRYVPLVGEDAHPE